MRLSGVFDALTTQVVGSTRRSSPFEELISEGSEGRVLIDQHRMTNLLEKNDFFGR